MTEKKSPWGKEKLDQVAETAARVDATPEAFKPKDWKDIDRKVFEQLGEVNCLFQHAKTLAGLTDQEVATFLAEKFGSIVGQHSKDMDQVAKTLSVFAERMYDAAKAEMESRKIQAILDRFKNALQTDPKRH